MNSITECLKQITSLTKKNLQILKTLNDAFYTRKNHIVTVIDGEQYVVPSFLTLESKIDDLEANLQNILDAPKTGEAFTYFDGTTQKMELFGYSNTPPKVNLDAPSNFSVSVNHIFKDFLSPQPEVKFDISSISNNIKHVLVKKVTIKNPDLINLVKSNIINPETHDDEIIRGQIEYPDLVRTLFNYTEGVDYVDYDTIRRLPLRVDNPTGEYEIEEIVNNWQDPNFEEHYTLRLNSDLVYHIMNGTIERNILVGDFLVTWNDKVELEVEDVNPISRTLTVKVLHGAYADLCDKMSGNTDLYKLKYHQVNQQMFEATKYINVPLEEDKHVCIFIAPINDTTNTQASFGVGSYFVTDFLTYGDTDFRTYYDDNVNNIGDALFAITNMMNDDDQVEKLTPTEFQELRDLKPILDTNILTVYQINKHLNDSESIKKIRNLYSQKVKYKNDLSDIEVQIDNINNILADSSFDDTDETRESYKSQLRELNQQRREMTQNITSIVQEISENANSSDTPIENAKYHIRGFVNINDVTDLAKIIGIEVEYRYKNKNNFTGNAVTIDSGYIYSDWNRMNNFMNSKVPSVNPVTGIFTYDWESGDDNLNRPSFNQVDIPITQGENVDIRVRYIYNLGWPLVTFKSDWSDILNMEFPEEFVKDVEILDIIAENNDDIKKNQFTGILEKEGVLNHVHDSIQDMDLLYFHQPEHIASGFYTPERRVIPLSDQLMTMAKTLADLQSEVNGATAQLQITLSDGIQEATLLPNIINNFRVQSYVDAVNEGNFVPKKFIKSSSDSTGLTDIPLAVSNLVINIYNPTEYTIKLHSLFPGDSNQKLDEHLASNKFDYKNYMGGGTTTTGTPDSSNVNGYTYNDNYGVWMLVSGEENSSKIIQRQNQFIYFRTVVDGYSLYSAGVSTGSGYITTQQAVDNDSFHNLWPNNLISAQGDSIYETLDEIKYMYKNESTMYKCLSSLYPHIGDISDITAPAGSSYYELAPGELVQIPLNFAYWLSGNLNVLAQQDLDQAIENSVASKNKTSRGIAFDIRTSLFSDPITYKVVVEAHYQDLQSFKMSKVNKQSIGLKYQPRTIINSTTNIQQKPRR